MSKQTQIETSFQIAKERYAELGVNVEERLETLSQISISLHCWQGDDVTGFENAGQDLTGGIQVTGNYPGKARNGDELRADLDIVYGLIPGKHRLNLHAIYAETGDKSVERNALTPADFSNWIEWAKEKGLGLDFNPTFFSHPKADDGFTLSSADTGIRQYWIEHAQACREIGAAMGNDLGTPCVTNVWIPDGSKDIPADRIGPRERLKASLDQVFSKSYDKKYLLDAVECKLFGIGSESYVVGSHEFYLGYAQKNNILLCLDSGHFHPTEVISDKISAVTQWVDELLLHVSRGVRWDSDHVVTLSDELTAIAQEIIRGNLLSRVHIGLDYFDASINRLAAWIIGTRNMIKALLMALLEPTDTLKALELEGNNTARLVLMEGLKTMPFSTVWDYYCQTSHVPLDLDWYDSIIRYEKNVLSART